MSRLLVIDRDRDAVQQFGRECLERGIGGLLAESVGEGVRALLNRVPVVRAARPELPLERRVGFELAGFQVLPRPVALDDVLKIAAG